MKYFVRFTKITASGTIARSGWRLRLFADSNAAGAFAQEMIDNGYRAEMGDVGEVAADAPTPKVAERNFSDEPIQSLERASFNSRKGRD